MTGAVTLSTWALSPRHAISRQTLLFGVQTLHTRAGEESRDPAWPTAFFGQFVSTYVITLHVGTHTSNKSQERKADGVVKPSPCLFPDGGRAALLLVKIKQNAPCSTRSTMLRHVGVDLRRQRSAEACVHSACVPCVRAHDRQPPWTNGQKRGPRVRNRDTRFFYGDCLPPGSFFFFRYSTGRRGI